jgi:hypothetical protein
MQDSLFASYCLFGVCRLLKIKFRSWAWRCIPIIPTQGRMR